MRRLAPIAAIAATVMLVLAPAIADARAGRSSSIGSRGSRTYQAPPPTRTAPTQAQPIQRSVTDPARTGPAAAPAGSMARPGLFGGGFGGLLMGGLLGAGLFGLLSGAGLFGGLGSFAGFLGLLLQVALIAGLAMMALRFFRNRARPATAGAGAGYARGPVPDVGNGNGSGGTPLRSSFATGGGQEAFTPAAADFQQFEATLKAVQAGWSAGDPDRLRPLVTPEMLAYFGEQHDALRRQGRTNRIEDVALEQGDLAEAWREGGRDYATVAMRFSARDWTEDAQGTVVEGDRDARTVATEIWTFVRPRGGRWELSAIQQTG